VCAPLGCSSAKRGEPDYSGAAASSNDRMAWSDNVDGAGYWTAIRTRLLDQESADSRPIVNGIEHLCRSVLYPCIANGWSHRFSRVNV
jgi:hypothetical protein